MMVDAMIGVAIIALSLTLCLGALRLARQAGETARQTQAARLALLRILTTTEARPGVYMRRLDGFSATVTVMDMPEGRTDLCQMDVAVSQTTPRKTWRMTATRWCEPPS